MGSLKHIALCAAVLLLLGSCRKGQEGACFRGTGDDVIETRELSTITSIVLNDRINLILQEDTVQRVQVEGGEKILDGIITEVSGGVLDLRNENQCNWVRRYDREVNVYVSAPDLNNIFFAGGGDIRTEKTLILDSLYLETSDASGELQMLIDVQQLNVISRTGAASVQVAGRAKHAFLYQATIGVVDQSGLTSETLHVNQDSQTDCFVGPCDFLFVELYNKGSIYYRGNPQITTGNFFGEGKLIAVD